MPLNTLSKAGVVKELCGMVLRTLVCFNLADPTYEPRPKVTGI